MGKIYITRYDKERLESLLGYASATWQGKDKKFLLALEEELDQAVIVRPEMIPANVVTMNSKVRVRDLDSSEEIDYIICFPGDADSMKNQISVLSPVGTALLGTTQGDVITWSVPSGVRRLLVKTVVFQPESSGEYHL